MLCGHQHTLLATSTTATLIPANPKLNYEQQKSLTYMLFLIESASLIRFRYLVAHVADFAWIDGCPPSVVFHGGRFRRSLALCAMRQTATGGSTEGGLHGT
jgi:hypothetical protein